MSNWKVVVAQGGSQLFPNPSVEKDAAGLTTGGTNTLTRTIAKSNWGLYGMVAEYSNDGNMIYTTATDLLSASTTYVISAFVYVPSNFDGTSIQCTATNYTGATLTPLQSWVAGDPTDVWVRIATRIEVSSDASGTVVFVAVAGPPSAGRQLWGDGFNITEGTDLLTYIDGDRPGCHWLGEPHSSPSVLSSYSRAGGVIKDLSDDFGFYVAYSEGSGHHTVKINTKPRGIHPGHTFERTDADLGKMKLVGQIAGTSLTDYHDKRAEVIKAVGLDSKLNLPVTIQYHGASVVKEAYFYYTKGLEGGRREGFTEDVTVELVATDPFWYAIGESAAALDWNDNPSYYDVMYRKDGKWVQMTHAGVTTPNDFNAMLVDDRYGKAWIGGWFINFDGQANADYLVALDLETETWEVVKLANGVVYDICKAPDGGIYIVGDFSTLGGVTVNGIAHYDPVTATVTALGPPSTHPSIIQKVAVDPATGNVWVGGSFTNLNAIANADYLAFWNGTSWNAVGSSSILNNNVTGLAFGPDGILYLIGSFTLAGLQTLTRAAKYDESTTTWTMLGDGFNNTPNDILWTSNGELYVVGQFTASGSNTVNKIARFTGAQWEEVGGGLTGGNGNDLAEINGLIYVGGTFTQVSGLGVAGGFAAWTGDAWVWSDHSFGLTINPGEIMGEWNGHLVFGTIIGSGTVQHAGVTQITYNGTAPSYPRMFFRRDGGDLARLRWMENLANEVRIYFNFNFFDGEELDVVLEGDDPYMYSTFRGRGWWAVPVSQSSQFVLHPGTQDILTFIDWDSSAPTMIAGMIWKDAYRGKDG